MTDVVSINQNEAIYQLSGRNNGGDTDRGGLQFGTSIADYQLWPARAEAACEALVAGLGIYAWSDVWTEFKVFQGANGEQTGGAVLSIEGKYDGQHSSWGVSTSSLDVKGYLRDLDTNTEVANTTIMHSDAYGLALLEKQDTFNVNLASNVPLEAGKRYAVGVRAGTTATADTFGLSAADFHTGGNTSRFVDYYGSNISWY